MDLTKEITLQAIHFIFTALFAILSALNIHMYIEKRKLCNLISAIFVIMIWCYVMLR